MHVQIVRFRLKSGSSRELFLGLTGQMLAWPKGKSGFVAHELYEGHEFWCDRNTWESAGQARNGLESFLETQTAKQMISLVESGYDGFFGEAVVALEKSAAGV